MPEALSLPIGLCSDLRFTPEQFEALCQANREAVMELAADGSLILMTPTGSETGGRNGALSGLLWQALRASGLPLKLFDSSTGFRLPDGSVLSPDAALVALDRWQALSAEQRRGFAPLCPDLVVELASASGASPSDEGPRGLTALRQKMAAYQRNGACLGWLLIPAERAASGEGQDSPQGQNAEKGIADDGSHKKALPLAGLEGASGEQSGPGRCDHRRSDALAQSAAPTPGGTGPEQGQWAWDSGLRGRRCVEIEVADGGGSGAKPRISSSLSEAKNISRYHGKSC
jgi:Uma2 family endonuclease